MADFFSNTKLWYPINEGSGTSVTDYSGNSLTGTLSSSAGWSAGQIGPYCYDFTGGRTLTVGTSSILDLSGKAISIALWVYPTSFANYYRIVERGNGVGFGNGQTQYSYTIDSGTGKQRLDVDQNGTLITCLSTSAMTLNAWNHIGFGYSGAGFTFYKNGSADGTTAATLNIASYPSFTTLISKYGGGAGYEFPGKMDDIRIIQRELAAADFAALYLFRGYGPNSQNNINMRLNQ